MNSVARGPLLALAGLLLLAACGGGGGSDGGGNPPIDPNNLPPVVEAGQNRSVESNQTVTLLGSATDPDGAIAEVLWEQVAGTPVVQISNATSLSATFFAPVVQSPSALVFRFTATDTGNASASDTVTITLQAPASNVDPIIDEPIAPQRANEGETVTLTASASDPDGQISRYSWAFVEATPPVTPALSITFSGNNDATPAATFTAPAVTVPTTLRFRLTVTDDSSQANTDSAETTVLVYPLPQPAKASHLYVADGANLISRFMAAESTPTEFTTDLAFGRFDPSNDQRIINGPFALTADGRLIQSDDEDANGIQEVCAFPRRVGNSQFNVNRDRRYTHDVGTEGRVENYAGIAIDHARGYLIAIDTFSGGGSADARALHVYGTAVSGVRQLIADIPLGSNGNDLLYDAAADRLFVTLRSGRIAAFDGFITEIEAARAAANDDAAIIGSEIEIDALIEIAGLQADGNPHDFRGIAYHRESDRLIVSDVGLTGVSGATDGAIYILSNATDAVRRGFGATVEPDAVIRGLAGSAPLGDPTDILLNGRDLIVADQANNRVYVYANIFSGFGPRTPAPADAPLTISGARFLASQPLDVAVRRHAHDLGSDQGTQTRALSLLAVRPIGTGDATQLQLTRLQLALDNVGTPPFMNVPVPANRQVRAVSLALNGDVYAVTNTPFTADGPLAPVVGAGSDGIAHVDVLNSAARNRLDTIGANRSTLRDRTFTAAATQNPRSSLIVDEFGVMLLADAAGRNSQPGISIVSVCGNGTLLGNRIGTQGKTPTGMDFDGRRGDLYVSFSDGTFGIFRAFDRYLESLIANPATPVTPNPLLVVTPQVVGPDGNRVNAASDFQAIEYLPVLDQLALVSQNTATPTFNDGDPSRFDGQLFIIGRTQGFRASELFGGNVDVNVTISGPATRLGDPVDLAFDGFDLYVAEQGEGLVLKFDNIATIGPGNVAPSAQTPVVGVTSIVLVPDYVGVSPLQRLPATPAAP